MATNLRPVAESTRAANAKSGLNGSGGLRARRRFALGLKWFYPGMNVKRWLLLIPIGLIPVLIGVLLLVQMGAVDWLDRLDGWFFNVLHLPLNSPKVYYPVGIVMIIVGLLLILTALIAVNRSIIKAVAPEQLEDLPEIIRRKATLAQGAKIVALGGGTGLSALLRGLKTYTGNLTAVVTMTDNGGSSGLLQQQLGGGVLPPGDIRNCLVALADAEPLMQQLFQYRFQTLNEKDGLSGHSFGNLLIAAMADITGDFERAVEETSNILAIRGRVLPSTIESVVLVGEMADGREVTGESEIARDPSPISRIKLCPDNPRPLDEVIAAIRQAEIICLGPGSVFTSLIPNILVKEITQAIASSKALRVYVCNVMTQRGETDGYAASDHVRVIEEHAAAFLAPGQRLFDVVLVNTAEPGGALRERYERSGADFVAPDSDKLRERGYRVVEGSFLAESAVVRHESNRMADTILRLFSEKSRR